MLISFTSIVGGLATILSLVFIRAYIARFHIDLFYALRYYTDRTRPPQSLMEYALVRWIVALVKKLAGYLPQTSFLSRLDTRLRRAGLTFLGAEFIVIMLISALIVGFVVFSLMLDWRLAVPAGILTIIAEYGLIFYLIDRRREKFVNQLGDCLTTVSNALRAGFSFLQAMDLVSREMEPPISDEFAHVMRDISYGMEFETALTEMEKRVDSSDFSLVVTAVLIQREVGGNLAQVLDTISDTINNRIRMRREVMTLTAQGRMSAWVLSGLPILLVLIQIAIDPHHFDEMLESQFGLFILIAAVVLEIIGFIVIRKIVNIKVE